MENSSRRLVRTGVSAGASFVALVTGLALGLYITVHALRGNPGAGTLLPSLAFGVLLSVVVQRLLRNPELWGITDEPSRVEPSRVEPSRVEQSSATPRLLYRSLRVLRAPPRAAPSYWWFWISLVVFVLAAEHGSRELGLT